MRVWYSRIRAALGSITPASGGGVAALRSLDGFLPERAMTATITSAMPLKTQACAFLGKTPDGFKRLACLKTIGKAHVRDKLAHAAIDGGLRVLLCLACLFISDFDLAAVILGDLGGNEPGRTTCGRNHRLVFRLDEHFHVRSAPGRSG